MDPTKFIVYFTIFCLIMILILTLYYVLSVNGVIKKWEVKPYNSTVEGFSNKEGLTGNKAYPANELIILGGNIQETIICNYDFTGTILVVGHGGNGAVYAGEHGGGGGGYYYDTNFNFKKGNKYTITINDNATTLFDGTSTVTCNRAVGINPGGCGATGSSFSASNCHNGNRGGYGSNGDYRERPLTNGPIEIGDQKFIVSGGGGGSGKFWGSYSGEYSNVGDYGSCNSTPGCSSITGYNNNVGAYTYGNGGGTSCIRNFGGGGAGGGGAVIIYYTAEAPKPTILQTTDPVVFFDFTDLTNKGAYGAQNNPKPVSPSNQCIVTTIPSINLPVMQVPKDGYLSMESGFAVSTKKFSMSFWAFTNGSNRFIHFIDTTGNTFMTMLISGDGSSFMFTTSKFNNAEVSIKDGSIVPRYGWGWGNLIGPTTYNASNWWNHITVTMDNGKVGLYFNSVLWDNKLWVYDEDISYMNIDSIKIFASENDANGEEYSYISDFRIYNTVLQQGDVDYLFCPDPNNLTVPNSTVAQFPPRLSMPNEAPKSVTSPIVHYNFMDMNESKIPNRGFNGTANDGTVNGCYANDRAIVFPNSSTSKFVVNGSLSVRDITIAYWYKTNGRPPYYPHDPTWSFSNNTNGLLVVTQNSSAYLSKVKGERVGIPQQGLNSTDSKWVHVIFTTTFDGDNYTFVNGVQDRNSHRFPGKSFVFTPILPLTNNYLSMPLGTLPQVADFRIYNYALSSSEAMTLYTGTAPTTPTTPAPTTPKPTTPKPIPTQFELPYSQIIDVISNPNAYP